MKKYILRSSNSRTDHPSVSISGELLNNKEALVDAHRNPFSPFDKDTLFSPLLPYEHTVSPKSKPAKYLVDFYLMIKSSPFGHCYVISQKLKNIFDHFKIQKHIFYKAELLVNQSLVKNYFVIQLLDLPIKYLIDFNLTVFENSKRRPKKFAQNPKEGIIVSDWEDLMTKIREKEWIYYNIQKLVVKEEFWKTDFMIFDKYGLIISEKLADAIRGANLYGIDISELDLRF